MTAALIHWFCLKPDCLASGSYEAPGTKTDTGPAVKHGHSTVEGTDPGALARMRARIVGEAA